MRCSNCHDGDLHEARRHKSAEKGGRVAVVTEVPVTVCPSCETVWYAADVAVMLEAMLTEMLEQNVVAVRSFPAQAPTSP